MNQDITPSSQRGEERPKRKRLTLHEKSAFASNTSRNRIDSSFKKNTENRFHSNRHYKKDDNESYDPNKKYNRKKQLEHKQYFIDPASPIRLNKFLANAGICSRREADEYIKAGLISVNGEIADELGRRVIPATDKVLFHDQEIHSERKIYILLNKPKNCVTTVEDTRGRKTVIDLVKNACRERIYPVGRLDRNTTGVLLLTNDGELAAVLIHPKYNKKKIYQVTLDQPLTKADMQKLLTGVTLDDGDINADEIAYIKDDDKKQIGIEIHSGKNRVIRRMFAHLGYKVTRLDRVFFAGLTKKNLPRGKWRFLTDKEISMLKMGAFE